MSSGIWIKVITQVINGRLPAVPKPELSKYSAHWLCLTASSPAAAFSVTSMLHVHRHTHSATLAHSVMLASLLASMMICCEPARFKKQMTVTSSNSELSMSRSPDKVSKRMLIFSSIFLMCGQK